MTEPGPTWPSKRRGKYNNRTVDADGHTFDSQAEYRRYCDLKLLQQAGEIRDLRVHTRWELLAAFRLKDGTWQRAITYEDDFNYVEVDTDAFVVEDVKGVRTQVFRLKEKLFRANYPDFDFRIVEA